jgi:hypothetical protein
MACRGRLRWLIIACLIFSALAGGCIVIPTPPRQSPHPLPPGSTYLLHLPGISGMLVVDGWLIDGLHDGGAAQTVEVYNWVGPGNIVHVLHDIERNKREAIHAAQFVAAVRRANPSVRIIICAESGGVAVALWMLEALPPDIAIDDLLMVSPSVSPAFDLTPALAHVTNRAYYTTTPLDVDTLGIGSWLLGNSDGYHGVGAGWVGFCRPCQAQSELYERLIRVRYNPAWIIWGNFGTHTGPMSYRYARNMLAPMLTANRKAEATTTPSSAPSEHSDARPQRSEAPSPHPQP